MIQETEPKASSNINNSNSASPNAKKSPNRSENGESSLHHLQRIQALTVGVMNKSRPSSVTSSPPVTSSSQPQRTNPIMAMENLVKSHMARQQSFPVHRKNRQSQFMGVHAVKFIHNLSSTKSDNRRVNLAIF